MGDVLTFAPRPKPASPPAPAPLPDLDLRSRIEEAAEVAVDTAERLIALLDRMDGDADLEDGGDAEPSLAAPEGHDSQVGWCCGGDEDREAEVPEIALPEMAIIASPAPRIRRVPATTDLPWAGNGNVVAFAGAALLDLIDRRA